MKLQRKLNILVKYILNKKLITIDGEALANLNFYQFKKNTVEFFFKTINHTKIKISDIPHYKLAMALKSQDKVMIESAENFYYEYLKSSWPESKEDSILKKVQEFKETFNYYKTNGIDKKIVLTSLPLSSDLYIVDGNHRASIGCALGLSVNAVIIPPDLAFLKYSYTPEFYGSGSKYMPYQSIYINNSIVIDGRRNDLIDRLKILPKEVLEQKRILDVACNVGMSCLLAKDFGASTCTGLEISPEMVDVATRLSVFNDLYPDVNFHEFNIDNENLNQDLIFDTVFMFSIYSHLKNPSQLIKIAKNNVTKYVVFEGHPGGVLEDYQEFMKSGVFTRVTEIGRLHKSRFRKDSSRILWLCEK